MPVSQGIKKSKMKTDLTTLLFPTADSKLVVHIL